MDAAPVNTLLLSDLENGCPGISPAAGKYLSEASKTCFDTQNHVSGVKISIEGISSEEFEVHWLGEIDDQIHRTWADQIEMTNYGACGIAVLLVLKFTKYTILQRARIGTGVDYWLSEKESELPFQNSARLEVSGILKERNSAFNSRVNQKLKQTYPTDSGGLPAYIVVVEFSKPKAKMLKK